jgi:hypothetical protein
MTENDYVFAFFPYLKTTEPVSYRGITIRNSDNLSELPADAILHLEKLRLMFFLRDHFRIKQMSYTFHCSTDSLSLPEFIQILIEFQTLICFFYSSPHPTSGDPFLRYEHSSLYYFSPKKIYEGLLRNDHNVDILPEAQNLKSDERKEVDGYEGVFNNRTFFYITNGSRIFPPAANLWLNISQDLYIDFNHFFRQSKTYQPLLDYFLSENRNNGFSERILTALTWYNRSIRIDIDESEALVNLAIAFESLLDLNKGDSLTARFKEAVGLLVGDVNRLDSWLTQFYDARSAIVHKGRSSSLMFVPIDDTKNNNYRKSELEYRSLVTYGRQIFRICAATVQTGAQLAKKLNLSSLLVTNRERFERICSTLCEKDKSPAERILSTKQDVMDIENYRFVPEKDLRIEQMIGVSKLMVGQYISTNPIQDPEFTKQMQALITIKTSNHYEALSFINTIQEGMKARGKPESSLQAELQSIVGSILDSIWGYAFYYYYLLKNEQKQENN